LEREVGLPPGEEAIPFNVGSLVQLVSELRRETYLSGTAEKAGLGVSTKKSDEKIQVQKNS